MNTAIQQVRDAARQISAAKSTLDSAVRGLSHDDLVALIVGNIFGGLLNNSNTALDTAPAANDEAPKSEVQAAPASSANVGRNVSVAVKVDPESIEARIAFVLIEANRDLTRDEILAAFKTHTPDWTPDSDDVPGYVSQRLATFSNPKKSNGIIVRGAKRGTYTVNPKASIPLGRGRNRKVVTVADVRSGNFPTTETTEAPAATGKADAATTSERQEPKKKSDIAVRALKSLQGTRKPVSFKAISEAIKVDARQFQMHGMSFIREKVLLKSRKKDDDGRKLFEINHKVVNAKLKAASA